MEIVFGREVHARERHQKPMTCRICDAHEISERVTAREMMFGTREVFEYTRCGQCGTLQLVEIPADLGQYYSGESYYSFNNSAGEPRWKSWLKRWAARGMVGRPAAYPQGNGPLHRLRRAAQSWIATIPGLSRKSAILDVGCGGGARLQALARLGFGDLAGIDPFLPPGTEGEVAPGLNLHRGELSSHEGWRYDCIAMHHSLEHVADPHGLLVAASERLKPGGAIYVGIPLLQDEIWREFGVNWAQLDAPRHLHLFTAHSFRLLADSAGLACNLEGTDMMPWSLAWSHAFAQDIPMYAIDGRANTLPFGKPEMSRFAREAHRLNSAGKGDQGYFVLTPA